MLPLGPESGGDSSWDAPTPLDDDAVLARDDGPSIVATSVARMCDCIFW